MARKKKNERGVYYFDKKKEQFKTSKDVWLTPVKIPTMILEPLLSAQPNGHGSVPVRDEAVEEAMEGDLPEKPEVPVVEVDYGKGRKGKEENPQDPDFLDSIRGWEIQKNVKIMKLLFNRGIAERAPDDFIDIMSDIYDYGPATLQYMWVLDCLSGDEEASALTEVILGQTTPTPEAVESAEEQFRGDGGQQTGE